MPPQKHTRRDRTRSRPSTRLVGERCARCRPIEARSGGFRNAVERHLCGLSHEPPARPARPLVRGAPHPRPAQPRRASLNRAKGQPTPICPNASAVAQRSMRPTVRPSTVVARRDIRIMRRLEMKHYLLQRAAWAYFGMSDSEARRNE